MCPLKINGFLVLKREVQLFGRTQATHSVPSIHQPPSDFVLKKEKNEGKPIQKLSEFLVHGFPATWNLWRLEHSSRHHNSQVARGLLSATNSRSWAIFMWEYDQAYSFVPVLSRLRFWNAPDLDSEISSKARWTSLAEQQTLSKSLCNCNRNPFSLKSPMPQGVCSLIPAIQLCIFISLVFCFCLFL